MRSLKLSAITPVLLLLIILAGCKKPTPFFDEINTGSDDANRKAVVKLADSENDINIIALNVTPTLEDVALITVTRDPNSQADANQPLTVKLAKKSSLITDYNTANGATFIELPLAAYTFSDDITNLTFAPGELSKTVVLHLKKDQMDLSKQYALGFTIAEVGAGGVISSSKNNVLYSIGVKNQYDGVYELTLRVDGWDAYGISSAATAVYPGDFEFITAGANSVTIYNPSTPFGPLQPGFTGGVGSITGATGFGATTPKYTFDPVTNKATSVVNTTPDDGRGRTLYLDPASTTSGYNPATKAIFLEYYMTQNGRPLQKITASYAYLGPR